MSTADLKPIYQKYCGNRKSQKLQVFKKSNGFDFVYQKFERTNPSQTERSLGHKQERTLVFNKTYSFSNISDVNFKEYPFFHLMSDFKLNN